MLGWLVDNSVIFHFAHASMLFGYLLPATPTGTFALRTSLAAGMFVFTHKLVT